MLCWSVQCVLMLYIGIPMSMSFEGLDLLQKNFIHLCAQFVCV